MIIYDPTIRMVQKAHNDGRGPGHNRDNAKENASFGALYHALMTMEEFKQNIHDMLTAMRVHPSQHGSKRCIVIAEGAFMMMKDDSEVLQNVLNTIQQSLLAAYPPLAAPSYVVIIIDERCNFRNSNLGSGHSDYYETQANRSFWRSDGARTSGASQPVRVDAMQSRMQLQHIRHQRDVLRNEQRDALEHELLMQSLQRNGILP